MSATEGTGSGIDLDHTAFAVHDALRWARQLRGALGATPVAGEVLPEFRYLLLYLGTADAGGRLELLEPAGTGFLTRFLARRGEGPHHVTFVVPDLRSSVRQVRSLGCSVVGEDDTHPAWREAFILPDARHGTVIQLAQTDRSYPPPADLLATRHRDVARFPTSRGAAEPRWWTSLWHEPAGPAVPLGPTHLASTDRAFSRRLFEDVLGAEVDAVGDDLVCTWPSGRMVVHAADRAGLLGIGLPTGTQRMEIGSAWIGRPGGGDLEA